MTVLLHLAETSTSALRIRTERRSAGTTVGPFSLSRGALGQDGNPHEGAADLIAEVLEKAGARSPGVTLLLPARIVRCRTVSVDVPVNGTVRDTHIDAAFRAIKTETEQPSVAVLYRQPSHYTLDRERKVADPLGQRARVVSVHVTVLSVPVKRLAAFEVAISAAGARLDDVVSTQASIGAAAFTRHDGATLYVGHGETVLCSVQDQRLVSAGTIPLGCRHLIGDIMRVCGLSAVEARAMVSRLLREEKGTEGLPGEVLDARLQEMGERAAELCHRTHIRQPLSVAGGLTRSVRAAEIWADVIPAADFAMASAPLDEAGLLLGASTVLTNAWGLHERPHWSPAANAQPGNEIVKWLQAHF
ncbi:hypothetical protein [Parvularcula sp. LCG005]|uniref:hypothetical protein n=1 Tax=Parvularcula sp. LCG005 TaxID=3078805 RepID=UPI002943914F|nr:hypothetical protein [Parvularcula sp. LCG005]WOI52118.1 hypothetical protein RUI03_08100 [Parvularcula sp. LCG005]